MASRGELERRTTRPGCVWGPLPRYLVAGVAGWRVAWAVLLPGRERYPVEFYRRTLRHMYCPPRDGGCPLAWGATRPPPQDISVSPVWACHVEGRAWFGSAAVAGRKDS